MFFLKAVGSQAAKRIGTVGAGTKACRRFSNFGAPLVAYSSRANRSFHSGGSVLFPSAKNWRVSGPEEGRRYFTTTGEDEGDEAQPEEETAAAAVAEQEDEAQPEEVETASAEPEEGAAADEVEEEKTAPSQHQFVLDRIQYNKEKKERIQVMRGKVAKQKLHNERKRERKIASRQHRPVVRDDDVDMPWQGDGKGKGPENAKAAKTHEHAKVILKNKKRSLSFRGKRMKQLQYEAANFWMTSEEDVEEELTGGKGRGGAKGSYTKKNLSLSSYSSTEWNTYRKAAADLKVKMTERAAGGSSPVASFTLAGTAQDVGDVCKAFRFLQELDRLTDDDIMAEVKDNFSFENMEALVAEAGREVQYRRQRRAKLSLDKMSDADFVVEAELTSFLVKLKRKLLELRWEHKVVKNEVNAVVSKIEEIVSSGGRKKGKSDTRAGRNGKRRQR